MSRSRATVDPLDNPYDDETINFQFVEDLKYLQTEAFDFSLSFNPHAGGHETVEDFIKGRDIAEDDWISIEQRDIAIKTQKFIGGTVYPNGSVSFFDVFGTDIISVVSECTRLCREDKARFKAAQLGTS